jgi:hypothetical protein
VYENGSLNIYNVSNVSEENSDLIQEKPEDFMNVSDIFYLSLWEYKSTREELFKLKKILQSYTSKKISFDTDFEENNAKLYCSEFCAVVLRELNPKAFSFSLSQIPLDHFYETILHRRILNYYPVDFFQVNPKFCKIYETRF